MEVVYQRCAGVDGHQRFLIRYLSIVGQHFPCSISVFFTLYREVIFLKKYSLFTDGKQASPRVCKALFM